MHENHTYTPSHAELRAILHGLRIPRCFQRLARQIVARAYDRGMGNYAAASGYAATAARELMRCEDDLADLNRYVESLEMRLDGAYERVGQLEARLAAQHAEAV